MDSFVKDQDQTGGAYIYTSYKSQVFIHEPLGGLKVAMQCFNSCNTIQTSNVI